MGMDVDYLFAVGALDELKEIVLDQPHNKRRKIANEILDFTEKMRNKYNKKNKENDIS